MCYVDSSVDALIRNCIPIDGSSQSTRDISMEVQRLNQMAPPVEPGDAVNESPSIGLLLAVVEISSWFPGPARSFSAFPTHVMSVMGLGHCICILLRRPKIDRRVCECMNNMNRYVMDWTCYSQPSCKYSGGLAAAKYEIVFMNRISPGELSYLLRMDAISGVNAR